MNTSGEVTVEQPSEAYYALHTHERKALLMKKSVIIIVTILCLAFGLSSAAFANESYEDRPGFIIDNFLSKICSDPDYVQYKEMMFSHLFDAKETGGELEFKKGDDKCAVYLYDINNSYLFDELLESNGFDLKYVRYEPSSVIEPYIEDSLEPDAEDDVTIPEPVEAYYAAES